MKLVRWEFQGLHVPMMEDEEGNLFCTTKQLAGALQTTELRIRQIKDRHADEFDDLSNSFRDVKEHTLALATMQNDIDEIKHYLNLNASRAGRELAAQKQTRHLRLLS